MNLFELLIYLALVALLLPIFFLSLLDFIDLERTLENNIDAAHAALIQSI
jgi:Tfp pilus assembly protein FimT